MSTTEVQTAITTEHQLGRCVYMEPDTSADPWASDYYVPAPPKSVLAHDNVLHDIRPKIFQDPSPFSLETHAFAVVKHKSILHSPPYSKKSFFSEETITDVYTPEVISLVKSVTGAKDVVIITTSVRSKDVVPPVKGAKRAPAADVSKWDMKGPMMSGLGDENSRLQPLRLVHIDYNAESARIMLRNFNPEVWGAAKDVIEAEDEAEASGTEYKGRRYAFYSVWRPLKLVTKDPLAVCDPNSIDRERDLEYGSLKRPSLKGDYVAGISMVKGAKAESQKWYWIKEQKEDEVYFLQFFDNFAENEGRPLGVPHCSPELLGFEGGETRESVETRVIAFW
ncbi:hypothetical protein N431DRAFT_327769 [Stipitochalara longipes BDJ]|nr:hypothetical protein N431DRAFT_327769 [Stipitochalara longipes BDJ]